jgi:hypothetical protein
MQPTQLDQNNPEIPEIYTNNPDPSQRERVYLISEFSIIP